MWCMRITTEWVLGEKSHYFFTWSSKQKCMKLKNNNNNNNNNNNDIERNSTKFY